MTFDDRSLERADPELARALRGEAERQEAFVELIASENYVSPRVLEALGSPLTNKYADGYPGRRAYSGCEWVDAAETLAVDRARRLFGAGYANVQPYSGSVANLAALHALMRPGERLLGMDGAEGGHVTHGGARNVSGVVFDSTQYGVAAADGRIDYDRVEALALERRPQVIVAGISAYSRGVDWAALRAIADRVGALLVADIAHVAGLVAAGLCPSPVEIADVVTTTTHKTLRGPRGGMILARSEEPAGKGVRPLFARGTVAEEPPRGPAKRGLTPFPPSATVPFAANVFEALDAAVWPGVQGGPLMHVIAAKAVAFGEALEPAFVEYQTRVVANARRMADHLAGRGFPIATGGTDNHMLLVDLSEGPIDARAAEAALEAARIAVNTVRLPARGRAAAAGMPNGLRLGTPAVTTRGFGPDEIDRVAGLVADVLAARGAPAAVERARAEAAELCAAFPVYAGAGAGRR